MKKEELINEISKRTTATKRDIGDMLDALGLAVQVCLRDADEGEHITLPGIGTLHKQHRAARKGRNPQTGEAIDIPARNVIDFRPGKALKDAIN
jgi:DNA-binding protein HU-beta